MPGPTDSSEWQNNSKPVDKSGFKYRSGQKFIFLFKITTDIT